jgi:hypothetical protein
LHRLRQSSNPINDKTERASKSGPRPDRVQTKAAVLGALLAGQAVDEVAKTFRLPVGTVKRWKHESSNVEREPGERIRELLTTYLEKTLETLTIHQEGIFRDAEWLAKQDAADLAVLHGVVNDKAVRLLQAIDRGLEDESDPAPTK